MNEIIKYPLSTEKAVRLMESENKMVFVVDKKATKEQIKKALISTLNLKVINLNTMIGSDGIKKAYVKLSPDTPALDVATQLGLM